MQPHSRTAVELCAKMLKEIDADRAQWQSSGSVNRGALEGASSRMNS